MTPMRRSCAERSDEELLAQAGSQPDALEALYRRHVGKTLAFALRRCSTPEEAHDLVAAVWLDVIDSAARFDPAKGRAVPWLFGIAVNLVADKRRRWAREREALQRLGGHRVLDEDAIERLESALDATSLTPTLLVALENLPTAERVAFELVALEGLSAPEAGEALGLDAAAVRMRLTRARQKLRRAIPEPYEEEVRRS